MDYTRIAKLHSKLFSVPQNSPEWNKRLSALSEDDRASVLIMIWQSSADILNQ